jgi:hypothetical protein
MLQALLIKWAVSAVLDVVIDVAKSKVAESDNDIDDRWVEQLENNKDLIKDTIKGKR